MANQPAVASRFSSAEIAAALGHKFPLTNIEHNWPLVCAALGLRGIDSRPCEIAAAATIAVETPSFAPVRERGGPAYFVRLYWTDQEKARELGNLSAEDAVTFRGRGLIQITGRDNYTHYGKALSIDLAGNPNRALEPEISAGILALYFRDRRIHDLANGGKWERVRRAVNGDLKGWADFSHYVAALHQIAAETAANGCNSALPSAADLDAVAEEDKARAATGTTQA